MLASISSSLTSQVASHGAYAVFVLLAIGAVFPAASELVMLYGGAVAAGAFASAHHISIFGTTIGFGVGAFVVVALAGTLGYIVGAVIGWAVGKRGGRLLFEQRWLHVTPERVDRVEAALARRGSFGVFIGTILPIVRSFVAIPAGVFEVPFGPFLAWTSLGALIWGFALGGAGYGLGTSYERFHHDFAYAEYVVLAGVVVLAAYLVFRWAKAATVTRRDDPAR